MSNCLLVLGESKEGYVSLVADRLRPMGFSEIKWCKNEAEAWRWYRSSSPRLVITDLTIARNEKVSPNPVEMRGLAFIQDIRAKDSSCLVMFLADCVPPGTLQTIQIIPRCRLIEAGVNWQKALDTYLQEWFVEQPPALGRPKAKHAEIVIHLNLAERVAQYSMDGGTFKVPLKVLQVSLDIPRVASFSDIIDILPDEEWPNYLHYIRQDLIDKLLVSERFMQDYQELRAVVETESDINIRFAVDRVAHPIVLEAASDRLETYWMLRSPVSRSIRPYASVLSHPFVLDEPRTGLRCLVVESNASGPVPALKRPKGKPFILEKIDTAAEAKQVSNLLTDAGLSVEVLQLREDDSDPRATLEKVLKERWDMVHYIGHSHFNRTPTANSSEENAGIGYIFLPHAFSPGLLAIDDFANMLRTVGVRFIYMSSCYSSQFAFALAAHNIPSSVGFRWRVPSSQAAAMATSFYGHLMVPANSLQGAFLAARREMNFRFPDERIWAAPVLMNQGD